MASVKKRLISVDDYYKMAEVGILNQDDRVELINGEIIEMSPIGSKHAATVDKISSVLRAIIKNTMILRVQNPIRLNNQNEPEPDISLLKYKEDFYSEQHPTSSDVSIVIEVSDSTLSYDSEVKSVLYASHDIPEYWIVDIENGSIKVLSDPNNNVYQTETVPKSIHFMGNQISIDDLLI
ncbi:MAG: Uma2 family endonuclease [Cyclobacteriaceae bacterium]